MMKRKLLNIFAVVTASLFLMTAKAQSVKDIIGDSTGKYIYSQSRDEDSQGAFEEALSELESQVQSYLQSQGMTDYNRNWKEWIKRIISEKYNITRVFLYISVTDLKPEMQDRLPEKKEGEVQKVTEPLKEENTKVDSKVENSVEKQDVKEEDVKEQTVKVENTREEIIKEQVVKEQKAKEQVVNEQTVKKEKIERQSTQLQKAKEVPIKKESVSEANFPDDGVGSIIVNILSSGSESEVRNQLSKAKNLRLISIYGDGNSKYLSRAYIITDDNGRIRVYSPEKNGKRTEFSEGESVPEEVKGRLLYWFLKK